MLCPEFQTCQTLSIQSRSSPQSRHSFLSRRRSTTRHCRLPTLLLLLPAKPALLCRQPPTPELWLEFPSAPAQCAFCVAQAPRSPFQAQISSCHNLTTTRHHSKTTRTAYMFPHRQTAGEGASIATTASQTGSPAMPRCRRVQRTKSSSQSGHVSAAVALLPRLQELVPSQERCRLALRRRVPRKVRRRTVLKRLMTNGRRSTHRYISMACDAD